MNSVDLAAPGAGIYSTWNSSDSSYSTRSGTSMAAPFVTGALALLDALLPGSIYGVEVSSDLQSWEPFSTMVSDGEGQIRIIVPAKVADHRFFRARIGE